MNRQKRHLRITSIIVMLALAILCYGGSAVGTRAVVADSHHTKFYSHEKCWSGLHLAALREADDDGIVPGSMRDDFGGQIG